MNVFKYKDLELSSFCLGCAQFGQQYGIANKNQVSTNTTKCILNAALDRGINFFDTASSYGGSEKIIGEVLGRRNVIIATKLTAFKSKDSSKEILDSLKTSLGRLHRKHLDIIYIHDFEGFFANPDIFLDILYDYKKRGLIRYIGISLYDPGDVDRALKYDEIDVYQIPHNILSRDFESQGKMKLLQKKGKLIVQRSVFLQGVLLMSTKNLPEYFGDVKGKLNTFYKYLDSYKVPREELLIQFIANKNFGPLVIGITSPKQLETDVSAFEAHIDQVVFDKLAQRIPILEEKYTNPACWNLQL
ncbi:MAG: aldo/keto reductase [Candidatus Curtissbacteria bacterium]|nr:aldo/keto reductase [Candidatus Curtissbacteria bacterium]